MPKTVAPLTTCQPLLVEDGSGRGATGVDKQIDSFSTLPDAEPVKALAPIRRLVLGAFFGALLAGIVLVSSTLHVMWTTDNLSMREERQRASQIADILVGLPRMEAEAELSRLADIAGLQALALAPVASAEGDKQSIPLLGGELGGTFLTWTADRPGVYLFQSFAPLRVPLMLALIGSVLGCLVVMQRRVRQIENQRILAQRQAQRDHLTGLPNRLALERELARMAQVQQRFSMLAVDLDRFKPINDLFGHHAGDLALIEVARRLAIHLRPGEMLARIGGDEFVMLVIRGGQRGILTDLARNCIAAVTEPLHVVGQNVSVGISLGIVEAGHDHPASALLKQADRALYEAKRLDGSAFCFAGDSTSRTTRDTAAAAHVPALLAAG